MTYANGVEDFRLLLRVEADALGVATTLDVEDTSVGPDVLVVSDELTRGVRREGRLSGARETEEERDSAGALVGRRVEREIAELDRLQVVLARRQ